MTGHTRGGRVYRGRRRVGPAGRHYLVIVALLLIAAAALGLVVGVAVMVVGT